jgi:NAD(P)-dependent dehydrogenase (short-subunit alcohol dehydrogenase family)
LKNRHGTETFTLATDVQEPEQVRAMIEAAHRHFGRLDVLINNAGVLRMAPVLTMPVSDMVALMNTNFWPVIHSVRAAAPLMAAQGGGHIINVGSGVSRRGLPYMAVYSATKFALAGLTEGLRIELARDNICFTTVYLGIIDTDMPRNVDRSRLPKDYPDHASGRIPAERVALAIARAVRTKPVEVYVPGWMRYALWFCAMFPALADSLIGRHYKGRSSV